MTALQRLTRAGVTTLRDRRVVLAGATHLTSAQVRSLAAATTDPHLAAPLMRLAAGPGSPAQIATHTAIRQASTAGTPLAWSKAVRRTPLPDVAAAAIETAMSPAVLEAVLSTPALPARVKERALIAWGDRGRLTGSALTLTQTALELAPSALLDAIAERATTFFELPDVGFRTTLEPDTIELLAAAAARLPSPHPHHAVRYTAQLALTPGASDRVRSQALDMFEAYSPDDEHQPWWYTFGALRRLLEDVRYGGVEFAGLNVWIQDIRPHRGTSSLERELHHPLVAALRTGHDVLTDPFAAGWVLDQVAVFNGTLGALLNTARGIFCP